MAEPLRITVHPNTMTPGPPGGFDPMPWEKDYDGAWGAKAPDFKQGRAKSSKPEDIDGAWGASRPDHPMPWEKRLSATRDFHRRGLRPQRGARRNLRARTCHGRRRGRANAGIGRARTD